LTGDCRPGPEAAKISEIFSGRCDTVPVASGETAVTAADDWDRLIHGLRRGDGEAARRFCADYGDALRRLADKHLPAGLRRRVGPEDVAQSACRTFLRRAGGGEFQLADTEALWRLLCAITLTKVREQTRFHLRQKRGLDLEVSPDPDASGAGQLEALARGPTPAEAAEFADQFERLLAALDDEGRQVVDLKLQEFTNEQVAEKLGCSERTVRRTLKRVQSELARSFGGTGA
jgi:RNA polymerase sigma-70 factor, ECF subfamily